LQNQGWTCHLVAHSHGGNIVVDALPTIAETTGCKSGVNGSITTLGTPFIDCMAPIINRLNRRKRRHRVVGTGSYFCILLFMAFLFYDELSRGESISDFLSDRSNQVLTASLAALLALGGFLLFRVRRRGRGAPFWSVLGQATPPKPVMLALNSPMDEAWQLLRHIREIANPFAPKVGFLRYLMQLRSDASKRIKEVDRILGGFSFADQSRMGKAAILIAYSVLLLFMFLVVRDVVHDYRYLRNPSFERQRFASAWLKDHGQNDRALHKLSTAPQKTYLEAIKEVRAEAQPEIEADWSRMRSDPATKAGWERREAADLRDDMVFVGTAGPGLAAVWFLSVAALSLIGGTRFYSALGSPFRYVRRQVRALAALPAGVGTYIAKVRGWPLVQEIAFGLENYPFKLPQAEFIPTTGRPELFVSEFVQKTALDRAVSARTNWFYRNFGEISELLSKMALSASDMSFLMRLIESDATLVHGTYYTDEDCIDRIADWITDVGQSGTSASPLDV
jgi:hypothetical protein